LRQLRILMLCFSQLELKLFQLYFCGAKIPSLISIVHFFYLVDLELLLLSSRIIISRSFCLRFVLTDSFSTKLLGLCQRIFILTLARACYFLWRAELKWLYKGFALSVIKLCGRIIVVNLRLFLFIA
jgi:hypothetical protein